MKRAAALSFTWLNYKYRQTPPLSRRLNRLVGVYKLFIGAADEPVLEESTRQLFLQAPEPREQAVLARGNFVSLEGEERNAYENRVISFFLLRLPATSVPAR